MAVDSGGQTEMLFGVGKRILRIYQKTTDKIQQDVKISCIRKRSQDKFDKINQKIIK